MPSFASRGARPHTTPATGATRRWLLLMLLAAATAFVGAAIYVAAFQAPIRQEDRAPPRFLLDALGPSSPKAPAVRRPAPRVEVAIGPRGYTVDRHRYAVSLTSASRGTWQRFRGGVSGRRDWGHETITVEGGKTEQFLTIVRAQGDKIWRWKLRTRGLTPRLGSGGSIDLWAGAAPADLRVLPPRILDTTGRTITPAGLAWRLDRDRSGWSIALPVDDSDLPLPYVIDPAISYRSAASAANASAPTSPTTLTINKPASVVEHDFLLARLTVNGGTNTTITPPSGWALVRRDNNATNVGQAIYSKIAGASEPASYTWNISSTSTPRAAGGIQSYVGVDNTDAIDDSSSGTGNSTSVTAPALVTTASNARVIGLFGIDDNTTFGSPAGMAERYDVRNANVNGPSAQASDVTQFSAGFTGSKTATVAFADQWIAQLVALRVDAVAPTAPAQTVSESSPDSHAAGSTLFYRPAGAGGSFTVTATTSDGQSGVQRVRFPGLAGGFTPTTGFDDFSVPYSRTYNWTTGATESGSKTVTAHDNATNSSTGTFTITPDSAAPTTSDNTGSIGSGWQITDQTVTLTPSDTGSTVAATYYTTDGSTPTTSSPQGTSITLSDDGVYTIRYFSVDNVGNAEAVATAGTQIRIDKNPPSSSLSVVEGARPDLQHFDTSSDTYYYNPAAPGDFTFQDAAADAGSGVASVAFPAIAEVGFVGAGVTDTSPSPYSSGTYSFDSLNAVAPATQTVVVTDNSGKQTSDAVSFVRDMAAPSGQTASLTGGPNFNTLSVPFTTGDGSDIGAGLDPTSRLIERASAPLSEGVCGTFGSFGGSYTSPDTSVVSGNCYRYRFTITDRVGNISSPVVTADAKVDTGVPVVSLADPGANLRGAITLTATASDPVSGITSVGFERSPAGAGTWTAIDTDASAPYSVSFDTASVPDGLYDFRAVATNGAGNVANAEVLGRRIDNTSPTATMENPGSALQGTVTLNGTATDSGSGISTVTFQYSPATAGTWTTVAVDSSAPYSAAWDTFTVNDGRYDLRVVALDAAGNSTTSSVVKNRQVTNQPPIVIITAPGDYINAEDADPYTITATTSVAVGRTVAQVEFFRCTDGSPSCATGTWISLAVDTAAPYSAPLDVGDDGYRSIQAVITDSSDSTGTDVLNVIVDRTDPSGGSITYPNGYGAGSVAITTANGTDSGSGIDAASGVIQRDSTTLANDSCGSFADSWSTVSSPDTTIATGCHRYRYSVGDAAGNVATYMSPNVVKVDTSPPVAPTLSFGSFTNTSATGLTVYYRPTAASGYFTVTASAADPQSGVAGYSFPAAGAGWTIAGSGAARTYSHTGSPADPVDPNVVRASNNAGLSSSSGFTVAPDSDPPSGGSVIYPDGYTTTGSIVIGTDAGTDALSGVDGGSGVIERDSAPLANGACDEFSNLWTTVTSPDTLLSGVCYRYRYRVADHVGNTTTYTSANVVKTDGTAPTAPALTLFESPPGPHQHVAGSAVYYNPADGNSGSFAVHAVALDTHSGVEKVVFPLLAGMLGGGDDLAEPYSTLYMWTSTSTASGEETVIARNGAGLTSTSAFGPTPDTVPPSGHSVASSAGPYFGSLQVPLVVDNGNDAGAGIDAASGTVERQSATLSNGACSGWSTNWTPVALSGGSDTEVLSGWCYRYRYTVSDNVGNLASPSPSSAAAKVDTAAPTTSDDAPAGWRTGAVTVTLSAADPESAIASTEYRVDGGPFQNGTTVVVPAPADGSNDGLHAIAYRSTDAAGNVEALRSATVRIDVIPPSPALADPGATISGVVQLSSTSSADTTALVFERAVARSGAWAEIATDNSPPYSALFETTTLPNGSYELRARAVDIAGHTGTSAVRTVQIANNAGGGGATGDAPGGTGGGEGPAGGDDAISPTQRLTLKVFAPRKASKRKRTVLVRVIASRAATGKVMLRRGRKVVVGRRAALRAGTTRVKLRLPRKVRLGRHSLVVTAAAAGPVKATASRSLRIRIVR